MVAVVVTGLYQKVDEAVQRGETWRAKEMLRGSIRSRPYDAELYERYGTLLLDLQEMFEAGKFLLLSGRRCPEYEPAIDLYLSRIAGDRLYYSFPRAARLRRASDYPAAVRSDLERAGFQVPVRAESEQDEASFTWGCWVGQVVLAVLAIAFVVCAAIGFWVAVEWLFL